MIDKEILLDKILHIIGQDLAGHMPDFVLIETAHHIVDEFERLGADVQKLVECEQVTSWLLKAVLDEREEDTNNVQQFYQ